jgi:hypothetical protein
MIVVFRPKAIICRRRIPRDGSMRVVNAAEWRPKADLEPFAPLADLLLHSFDSVSLPSDPMAGCEDRRLHKVWKIRFD